MPSQMHQRSL